jgi:metal-responsive CopG/Arc/MetJ family transcriptional regulator
MKVSVSIPDQIFHEAEALARRLNISRSELYSRALKMFLIRNPEFMLTARMDAELDVSGQ